MTEPLRTVQRYGWKPSLPDPRDLLADLSEITLPAEVDPRGHYMPPVYDQGHLGSCTANAVCGAIDAWRIREGLDPFYPSRLALYALERIVEGAPLTSDTGAFGRDGFKVARRYGLLPEKDEWAYVLSPPANWQRDPRPALKSHHDDVKLQSPYKVVPRSVDAFKAAFAVGQTVALGFSVFESFESSEVASSGVMPIPNPRKERLLGGHEVLAVGYLADHPQHALVRNSWGTGWGDGGYFLMPWAVILDRSLSDDFRTIYRKA